MFVNILTADHKYSLLNRNNLKQPIQMQLSHKKKTFSKCVSIYSIFKKKMTIIADVFPEIADSEKRGSKNL